MSPALPSQRPAACAAQHGARSSSSEKGDKQLSAQGRLLHAPRRNQTGILRADVGQVAAVKQKSDFSGSEKGIPELKFKLHFKCLGGRGVRHLRALVDFSFFLVMLLNINGALTQKR